MALRVAALLLFLYVCSFIHSAGLTVVIHTEKTVMARLGEDAPFRCQLLTPTDVSKVTWRKISPGGEKELLASHDKYFGQRVEPEFSSRVEFEDSGLQNSSVVIRPVQQEDVGCYSCLFDTSQKGAFSETTCLELYELLGPVLDVRESNSSEELVVSCSATGRPRPSVTITVPQQDLQVLHNSSDSSFNNDSTVTVTHTAVLQRLHANRAEVGCEVGVQAGPQRTVSMMLSGVKHSSDEESEDDEPSANGRSRAFFFVYSAVWTCCVLGVIFLHLKRKHHSSSSQKVIMLTRDQDLHTAEAPLQGSSDMRQRYPKKNEKEATCVMKSTL